MRVVDVQAALQKRVQDHVLAGGDARDLEMTTDLGHLDDDAIDRALRTWSEEACVAYMARINNYLRSDGTPDLEALRKADEEAERQNRDLMRRAIMAALEQHSSHGTQTEQPTQSA